tara:strand:- start:5215 stop:6336 length:1122 start_codon:yes stop_codon:yes gene_type:complete
MASLIKKGNQWTVNIRKWNGIKQELIKYIPLRTNNKIEARVRFQEVKKYEKDIKKGIEFQFSWLKVNGGSTTVIVKGLDHYIKMWINYLKQRNIASSTFDLYKLSINFFNDALGNITIEELSIKHIDTYKNWLHENRRINSPTTINIYLKSIRVFLNWLYDREYINRVPKIDFENTNTKDISYFTESEYHQILNYKYNDRRFPLMYKLYWETGMRLEEGFHGKITKENNQIWLDIPKEHNKSKSTKSIQLDSNQLRTVELIQNIWKASGKSKNHIKYYSKQLKKVIRSLGIDSSKHFHSFRHSYGMRRIIELNGNITQLRDEMGHSSVKVTEIYSKAKNIKRVYIDFPSLAIIKKDISTNKISTKSINNYVSL